MNETDIENNIKDIFIKEIEVPYHVKNTIKRTLYEQKEKNKKKIKRINIIKILSTACACCILVTGVVFAKDIGQFLDNIFNNRKGISNAIENGYISSSNMKYIESNKIGIKIDNFLMDNYNLNIEFNINLNQSNIDIEKLNEINISKLIMYDENNNILYCNDEQIFNNWANENEIDFKIDNFNEKNINSGLNYYISKKTTENNQLNLVFNLSAYNSVYPKSKKIYIDISEIIFSSENEKICANGIWNIQLDVPEQFYNREVILYKQKNINDEKFEILEAVAYDTGFNFKLKVKEKQEIPNIDPNALWNEMEQEYIEYNNNPQNENCEDGKHHYIGNATEQFMTDFDERTEPLKDIYIENQNGEKFYITQSTTENGVIDRTSSTDYFTYTDTFDITKYNITNELYLHFTYNNNEFVIELVKAIQ